MTGIKMIECVGSKEKVGLCLIPRSSPCDQTRVNEKRLTNLVTTLPYWYGNDGVGVSEKVQNKLSYNRVRHHVTRKEGQN